MKIALLWGLLGLGWLAHPGLAASDHDHHPAQTRAMPEHPAGKWAVDDVLRNSMDRMHRQVVATPSPHATAAARLADELQRNVEQIIQHCKLAPAADEDLHHILNRLLDGARMLGSDQQVVREQGLQAVIQGMVVYQDHFDHPQLGGPLVP